MRRFVLLALSLLLCSLLTQAAERVPDNSRFEGRWVATAFYRDGERVKGLSPGDSVLEFQGSSVVADTGGDSLWASLYIADSKASPKRLVFLNMPDNKPMKFTYELQNDTLRLCQTDLADKFPSVVGTAKGDNLTSTIYKRQPVDSVKRKSSGP